MESKLEDINRGKMLSVEMQVVIFVDYSDFNKS